MSNPRLTQQEYDRRIDAIKVCGANRGPHDYMPIEWVRDEKQEHVRTLMCRTCLVRVEMKAIYEHFKQIMVE